MSNFGFGQEPKMYTLQELNEAIWFNQVIGAFIGIGVTLGSEALFAWVHGWF